MSKRTKKLLRPHIYFKLVIKTPLAKELYGMTIRMANALTHVTFESQMRLPPERAKRVTATSYEIIAVLQNYLAEEKSALQDRQILQVTKFPVTFTKEISFCYANAVTIIKMLVDLDTLVQQWYDLLFQGELDQDDFEAKQKQARDRFRRASVKINSLSRSCGHTGGKSAPEYDQQVIEESLAVKRRSQ